MNENRPLLGERDERVGTKSFGRVVLAAMFTFGLALASTVTLRPGGMLRSTSTHGATVFSEVEETKSPMKSVKVTTEECAGDRTLPVLNGTDTVAYFSMEPGEPAVFGSERYKAVFNGYTFLFATRENMLIFENNPEQYIPQWGGFCSYGIAHEIIWMPDRLGPPSDPNYWMIVPGGKLHVFRSSTPRAKFMRDIEANLEHGSRVWNNWFGERGQRSHPVPFDTACFCSLSTCEDG